MVDKTEDGMVFDNLEVVHKAFGKGIITAKSGKYITVTFESSQKTFVYPDAFEKFLTLADGSVSDEIRQDIEKANQEKEIIINRKNEENIRSMTHGIVIPGKESNPQDSDEEESSFKNSDSEEI